MALQLLYAHARTEEDAILFLQTNNLLTRTPPNCATCNRVTTLIKKSATSDNRYWRCPTNKSIKVPLRRGSFFEHECLPLRKIVELLLLWAFKEPIINTTGLTGVFNWLDQHFGDEPIPQFEVNLKTIKCLYQLLLINKRNDKMTRLLIDDTRQKTEEFNADTLRLERDLSKLNMSGDRFSQAGLSSLRALAHLGKLLRIKNASDTCYLLSMRNIQEQIYDVAEQLEKENKDLHLLVQKSQSALKKQCSLQEMFETMKKRAEEGQALNSKRKEETLLLKRRSKAHSEEMTKMRANFTKSGAAESIFHDRLVKKEQKLQNLQKQLEPLKQELQGFSSLPPDLVEAHIKIEHLRRELAEVEKQMSACVDPAHT